MDDISSNRLSNYGSSANNIATYDASFVGTGIITTTNNSFVTGLGDLSLNNTMGSTATNYVIVDNSITLNPSSGLSISFWFSSTGISNTKGTFLSLPFETYTNTSNNVQRIELDISGSNMIYSGIYSPNLNIFNSIILSTSILSSITNFNSTSCDDYGNIVIATNSGIFYSSDYGNTLVASSGISGKVNSVSINNVGIGLACTATNLYSSSDYGKTWTTVSSAPSLGTSNYYYQVQVTQTGYSYVGTAPKNNGGNGPIDGGLENRNANAIYYSNDNFKNNMNPMTTGYPTNYWYFTFSSPGYGIICMYYASPFYFNGTAWSVISLGNCCMISMSDNGNYLVSPSFEGTNLYYATITNGTVNTINSYAYQDNNIGFCSVANNGNCLFRGGSVIFNFTNVVVSNTNYSGFGAMQSFCFSSSGNYYVMFTSTNTNQLIVKSPYYI
jgi:hypothetical protein